MPAGQAPVIPAAGAISTSPDAFPDTIEYDETHQRLHIGTGYVDHVSPAMWSYEVSGKQVIKQWFSYRQADRERPIIGDRRPPSRLGEIQPDRWPAEYTSELLNVLNVLGRLIELEPAQAELLERDVAPRPSRSISFGRQALLAIRLPGQQGVERYSGMISTLSSTEIRHRPIQYDAFTRNTLSGRAANRLR